MAGSLDRIALDRGAGKADSIVLKAARGECESFQIGLRAGASEWRNVHLRIGDLTSREGGVLPVPAVRVYREHFAWVGPSRLQPGGGNRSSGAGWYADALIPVLDPAPANAALTGAPVDLASGQVAAFWVDVCVPRSAQPGQYNASIEVLSDQGAGGLGLSLEVWSFELPLQPMLESSFSLWTADSPQAEAELLENRVSPAAVAPERQRGLFALGLRSVNVGAWSGANGASCRMDPAPSAAKFRAWAKLQLPGLGLYNYTADEIDVCGSLVAELRVWARNMHAAGIRNLVTMRPRPELYDDGAGRVAVDIWAMLPSQFRTAAAEIAEVQARGAVVWSYTALVQDPYSPKWLIDYAPINLRIHPGFLSQSLGLRGLLYWRVDAWNEARPWDEVNNTGVFGEENYPGEGVLVYPGGPVGVEGVVPSLRLKRLRDGVDDFDYVELLGAYGRRDWALAQIQSIAADWEHWTKSPAALLAVRDALGAELDRLWREESQRIPKARGWAPVTRVFPMRVSTPVRESKL